MRNEEEGIRSVIDCIGSSPCCNECSAFIHSLSRDRAFLVGFVPVGDQERRTGVLIKGNRVKKEIK